MPPDPPRDPRVEGDVDREALTPKESGAFNVYASAAYEKAAELASFAFLLRKRLTSAAAVKALLADQLEADLRELGARFGAWPNMNPETVAFERYTLDLPGALLELREQARLLMLSGAEGGPPPRAAG